MRITFMLLVVVFVCACKQSYKPLPLPTMSRLLTEIYIAEAYTQRLPIQPTKNDKAKNDTLKRFYACIFSENNTTETEFKKSINWYKSHPDLLDSVYQQTLSDLAVLQSRVNSSRQH